MATTTAAIASPTSTTVNDGEFRDDRRIWWFSPEAYVIKFAVLTAIFGIFFLWFVGGYIHAKRRVKKGKKPLGYHAWLLPRHVRAQFDPRFQEPMVSYYQVQDGYAMHNYPPPPPAYNPNGIPPAYGSGGAKVMNSQPMYAPPPGPPPSGYAPPQGPPPSSSSDASPPEQGQPQQPSGGFLGRFRR